VADPFFRQARLGEIRVQKTGASFPAILFPRGTFERPDPPIRNATDS
jgi:hypothetical protein